VAAGAMAISSEFGNYPWEERSTRLKNLQIEYYQAVKGMLGSAYCRDLKPTDETQRQVCNRIIADVAGIAAKLIERERNIKQ
jgi:hypothetical protein